MSETIRVLIIGDVFGKEGRRAVRSLVPKVAAEHGIDLAIANVENAAGGFGITPPIAEELLATPLHCLTSGNHIWDKKEIEPYLALQERLLRPVNYPRSPGRGVFRSSVQGVEVAVMNVQGRVFMPTIDCPFQAMDRLLDELAAVPVKIVDFHAEATSEKQAMGWFLDGKVSVVVGTHTHVQTADERVLAGGTAYITDIGMTGPYDSIIGSQKPEALQRLMTGRSVRFKPASGDVRLCAVVIEVDRGTGKATRIERLQIRLDH